MRSINSGNIFGILNCIFLHISSSYHRLNLFF